jgi:hypothetical protein
VFYQDYLSVAICKDFDHRSQLHKHKFTKESAALLDDIVAVQSSIILRRKNMLHEKFKGA